MSGVLEEILTHEACGRPFRFLASAPRQPVCSCVTASAIAARTHPRVAGAHALYVVMRKLHEIEKAGQPLKVEDGCITTPCACCHYQTWNDSTCLDGAYEAAGIS